MDEMYGAWLKVSKNSVKPKAVKMNAILSYI
jgi:hypothetical protein